MGVCTRLYDRYKKKNRITDSSYIDPKGFEYTRSVVICGNCIFGFPSEYCVLHKENGMSNDAIIKNGFNVNQNNYCEYYITNDFSEEDNEDEKMRAEVMNVAERLKYPEEYWERRRKNSGSSKKSSNWFVWLILIGAIAWFLLK